MASARSGDSEAIVEDAPEVGYLGSGAMLSVGGMTFPNGRLARLLADASHLKILLLLFDGLLVTGGEIVRRRTAGEGTAMSPIASRRAAHLMGHDLNFRTSTPIDLVAEQLADVGVLSFIPSMALIGQGSLDELLLAVVDAVSALPVPTKPLDEETMVPFDGGLLDPLMSDETVNWLMEELQRLGLARIEDSGPLFAYLGGEEPLEDEGSSVRMFGVTQELSDFYSVITSQLVVAAGEAKGVHLSPVRSGDHLPDTYWRSSLESPPDYLDLVFLHADLLDLDLDDVPLHEILDFREEHRRERRRFLRQLRSVLREVKGANGISRAEILRDYLEEATYLSDLLATSVRRTFRRRGRDVLLGGAAIATSAAANPVAGALAAARTVAGLSGGPAVPDAFTYFYKARSHLTGRLRRR